MAQGNALVVDDHAALADNIVELLLAGLDGVTCRVAPTGTEALRVADESLDIAFIDLHLPDAHGVELIRELREKAPFVQVVIITGDSSVESAIGALDRGAFSYVVKPFSAEELIEKGKRALDRARLLREREALRIKLEQSEERHRNIIESVPAFVVALDADNRIQLWNRRLEQATGFTREEMLGTPGTDIVGTVDGDVRLPMKNGGHRMVRWRRERGAATPSEPVTFAAGVDVTEERVTQRLAARTERLVAVGTLAAGLAHEVRNPLNSASLQLQVLERRIARGETQPETLQSVVSIVHNEIRRLDRLVNEFLAFARPAPLNLRPVALNEVLEGVLHLVRPECDAARVRMVVELDRSLGSIQGDEERLRQVFLNVIRNAVEAMGKSGTLTVSTHAADARGYVRVDIADTGPGFPESAPIFDAFYTTKENGTGLGLSIVHSIVSDHGGNVLVESRPGHTQFSIQLPQPGA